MLTPTNIEQLAFRLARENLRDLRLLNPDLTFADTYRNTLAFYLKIGPAGVERHEKWLNRAVRSGIKSGGRLKKRVDSPLLLSASAITMTERVALRP